MVSSFGPHNQCAKDERVTKKLDALRLQTGPSLSKCEGFRRKLICYKGISFFYTFFNSRLFEHSICTIQRHIQKFEPFLTSVAIFMHLMICYVPNDPGNGKHLQMNS